MNKFDKIMIRIKREGLTRTLSYLFGTVFLPLVKINFEYIYRLDNSGVTGSRDFTGFAKKFCSYDEFDEKTLSTLSTYGGPELLSRYRSNFGRAMTCYILFDENNAMTAVTWVSRAPRHIGGNGRSALLVSEGFTLPDFRGQNQLPSLLYSIAADCARSGNLEDGGFVGLISFTNQSSQRALSKIGFRRTGRVIEFMGTRHVREYSLNLPLQKEIG